jgi:hypothetical protein
MEQGHDRMARIVGDPAGVSSSDWPRGVVWARTGRWPAASHGAATYWLMTSVLVRIPRDLLAGPSRRIGPVDSNAQDLSGD